MIILSLMPAFVVYMFFKGKNYLAYKKGFKHGYEIGLTQSEVAAKMFGEYKGELSANLYIPVRATIPDERQND